MQPKAGAAATTGTGTGGQLDDLAKAVQQSLSGMIFYFNANK